MEEAISQSEQYFRLLFETMHQGVVYQDADGTILSMNPSAERILGLTSAEFLGSSSVDQEHFTIREDGSPFPGIEHPAMVALQTGQEVHDVVMGVFNPREDCYRWINIDAIPLFQPGEDKPYQVYTLFDDITERKRSADAVSRNETMLRAVLEQMPSGVTIRDAKTGTLILSNDRGREIMGALVEFPEQFTPQYRGLHSDGRLYKIEEWPISRSMATGEVVNAEEIECERSDGTRITLSFSSAPVRDSRGQIVIGVGIFHNITERKRAEQELAVTKDRLASDLDAMARLHKISAKFVGQGDMHTVLDEIVKTAIAITHADMGNIQLFDLNSGNLKIMAHHGFEQPFLDYWNTVHRGQGACGTALGRGERVIIDDVTESPIFVGTPALQVQLDAGVRAVQSTPLLSRSGNLLGMLSTHYRTVRRPDERDLQRLDLLARLTTDIIERTQAEEALEKTNEELEVAAEELRQQNDELVGAQSALRGSEEKYRELVENANSIIIKMDRDGKITFFNDYAQKFFGYSLEEVLGQNVMILIPPIASNGSNLEEMAGNVLENPDDFVENINENVRKNGERVWISWRNKAIRDARGDHWKSYSRSGHNRAQAGRNSTAGSQ